MKSRTAVGGMMLALGLLAAVQPAAANNIAVTNVVLANQRVADNTVDVQFDLSWDNSWRSAEPAYPAYTNWDAAWIFVKYRNASGNWQHATLSANRADHTCATNSTIDPTSDGTGAFVYRSGSFAGGTVSYPNTRLRWNYAANGLNFAAGAVVTVSVYAIEMVYVPQGGFYVGSGGSERCSFTDGAWVSGATIPFQITSEAALTITNAAGNLWGTEPTYFGGNVGESGTLPSTFPKGYAAFYCMKYKITQGQYADFLNKLTATQASARDPGASTYRYTITGSYPAFSASAPDRACNHLGWNDGLAYADWAGLRPMTELEYEKACRGPATPVADEYPWGSTSFTQLTNEIGTAGSGTETPSPATANCCVAGGLADLGPTRVGIFATALSDRVLSGATYWGIMEMAGNLEERPVSVATASRVFTGLHGDGNLASDGSANVANWPTDGAGMRGSDCGDTAARMRVSDRFNATYAYTGRFYHVGWRGVRSAP
jgi:formylglycine-generating enzyme required for sulfatase activity